MQLWTTTTTATLETTNAAGEPISTVEQLVVPITLADLLLALLAGAMTLVVARNLPGLLELSVFRQLRASAGERYAYIEHRLRIIHDLHMEIDRAFRAEGIEIAFPQRDLHVRTLPVAAKPRGPYSPGSE